MVSKESLNLLIRPCYDGHMLVGVQEVAGNGLSVISIKESHRHCRVTPDPSSKQPLISCAQGIKARNSFWNLHKPDLRRVKGLECATTESVTQLFRAHNVQNGGKPTYKKKLLRLLESLVTKKSKPSSLEPEVLMHNSAFPVTMCVLSSVCQEKELKKTGIIQSQEKLSIELDSSGKRKTVTNEFFESDKINILGEKCNRTPDTVYLPFPPPPNTLTNSSDNTLVEFGGILNPANYISTSATRKTVSFSPIEQTMIFPRSTSLSSRSFKLEAKSPILDIVAVLSLENIIFNSSPMTNKEILGNICTASENLSLVAAVSQNCLQRKVLTKANENSSQTDKGCILESFCVSSENKITNELENCPEERIVEDTFNQNEKQTEEKCIYSAVSESDGTHIVDVTNINLSHRGLELSGSEVVQTIFKELFADMQKIDDYISSYVSSFCTREEEVQNYPALNRKSAEIVSHFFEEIHNSTKMMHNNDKSSNISIKECHNTRNELINANKSETSVELPVKSLEKGEEKNKTLPVLVSTQSDMLQQEENIIHEATKSVDEEAASPGYCYWEDTDILLDLPDNKVHNDTNSTENIITQGNSASFNTSVVPVSFFHTMWGELTESVFPEGATGYDGPYSYYSPWTSVYDEDIFEEARVVVNSIDNFVTSGCFPCQANASFSTIPCSIVEIDNFEHSVEQTLSTINFYQREYEPIAQRYVYPQSVIEQTSEINREASQVTDSHRRSNFIENEELDILEQIIYDNTATASNNTAHSLPEYSDNNVLYDNNELNQIRNENKHSRSSNFQKYESNFEVKGHNEVNIKLSLLNTPVTDHKIGGSRDKVVKSRLFGTNNKSNAYSLDINDEREEVSGNVVSGEEDKDSVQTTKSCPYFSTADSFSCNSRLTSISAIVAKETPSESTETKLTTFVIPDGLDDSSNRANAQLLFSSPKVQLNLTNPLMNANKK